METQMPDIQSLLERVEKLEKDARFRAVRLRSHGFVIATIMLLIVSYVLLPRLSELWHRKTVSARNLILQDREGDARASLMVLDDSGPYLLLLDREKKIRVLLGLSDDGEPQLLLNDDEGKPRVVLDVSEKGEGRLSIYDAKSELVDTVPRSGEFIMGVEDEAGTDVAPKGE